MSFVIKGLPSGLPPNEQMAFRARIGIALKDVFGDTIPDDLQLHIVSPLTAQILSQTVAQGIVAQSAKTKDSDRLSQYQPRAPRYHLKQLVMNPKTEEQIRDAIADTHVFETVYETWGLKKIEPNPHIILSFHGPPGNGKTLAAEAIAAEMGKQIIAVNFAEIASMYVGEGSKNVDALFQVAAQTDALLFVDEAESVLARRKSGATGTEGASNAITSQFLIRLEQHTGIVIFATNLVEEYDPALETRLQHIHFPMPDQACRRAIWQAHLPDTLPLATDVSLDELAQIDDLCGRDINNAVQLAAKIASRKDQPCVSKLDFEQAIARLKESRINTQKAQPLNQKERSQIQSQLASLGTARQTDSNAFCRANTYKI
ncbi:MAG: ATP-binding protein [Crocosphaera sp.]|uniref:ATP-binding protein n=1 Tax=Crocosphaera sp. TaxID=2729996 RepID=UPI002584963E|nr:ATP-binding protein [Crocosphaera sp.]MCH2245676.1 ATP-binding protein [Crocosphaera sp.]